MPAYQDVLTDEEIEAVVVYIKGYRVGYGKYFVSYSLKLLQENEIDNKAKE